MCVVTRNNNCKKKQQHARRHSSFEDVKRPSESHRSIHVRQMEISKGQGSPVGGWGDNGWKESAAVALPWIVSITHHKSLWICREDDKQGGREQGYKSTGG